MAGVTLMMAKGLDMDIYARSMGVDVNDLLNAHPGWRPWCFGIGWSRLDVDDALGVESLIQDY
jgi:hypothetical protein